MLSNSDIGSATDRTSISYFSRLTNWSKVSFGWTLPAIRSRETELDNRFPECFIGGLQKNFDEIRVLENREQVRRVHLAETPQGEEKRERDHRWFSPSLGFSPIFVPPFSSYLPLAWIAIPSVKSTLEWLRSSCFDLSSARSSPPCLLSPPCFPFISLSLLFVV